MTPPSKHLVPPLAIHILWHAKEEREEDEHYVKFVKPLYQFFNRSVDEPLDIFLGIPIYLYPTPNMFSNTKITRTSSRSCIIVLADWAMLKNEAWHPVLKAIRLIKEENKSHLLLSLSLTKAKNSFFLHHHQLMVNDDKLRFNEVLIRIAHSTFRHLKGEPPFSADIFGIANPAINIFISHAKADGGRFAKELKDFIDDIPELRSYYDAKDIPLGSSFGKEIEEGIARSVLLVLHSDQFSSREWCRREILWAKKHGRPVLVLNQFEEGERRSFPYLGNVPHLHFIKSG
ncbi:MAG: toll/interleukin-1 receptor domain-containing protein, partial [Bacteroidota bacterium]